jgi:flagellar protein FliS
MTASPMQLVLMLYNAAKLRVRQARTSMAAGDKAGAAVQLQKAQEIVGELMSSLDMHAGEVADNLFRIYEFLSHRLIAARIGNRPGDLDIVLEVLGTLEDAWARIGPGGGRLTEGISVAG